MPNRDSEKLITDGYTTTLLGDELMVCENMKHIRVTSVPSYTEVGMIILCLRGTAKICIFDNIHILAKNELAVIVLSRALFDDTLSGFSRFSPLFFVYMRSHYWYELTGEEIERFKLFYGSLSQRAKDPTHFFRRESVLLLLRIFYLDIYNEYYSKSHLIKGGSDMGKSKLAHDFFCLIMQHYREHKDVAFYADKLCITSKYLSMVIKEASGKTAKDWIVEYAILEIKAMLKNSTMNIQEISIKTNFANQSSLGRFFRKHTGMTLTEYRMHR